MKISSFCFALASIALLSGCEKENATPKNENCASFTDDSRIDYRGPYQQEISDLLSRTKLWRIPSCKGGSDGVEPKQYGNGCQRDRFVDAAVLAAWVVEYQWRTDQKDEAFVYAVKVWEALNGADALCSNRPIPTTCINCECGTLKIWPCLINGGSGPGTTKTGLAFTNPVYTPITVTVDGTKKVVEPGATITFEGTPGTQAQYEAETSGKTSNGSQIGLLITWSGSSTFPATGTRTLTLTLSSDFFFLFVANESVRKATKLFVNYGLQAQTTDNIIIPNDKVKYGTLPCYF